MSAHSLTPLPLTAVLLAGGRSERMGRDKALVEIEGQPLWRRQIALLEALPPAGLIISGPRRAEFAPGTRCIEDSGESRGPLSGVAAALQAATQPHVLVLAVDLPRMSVEFLRHLSDVISPGIGVVPFNDEHSSNRRFY